GQTYSTQPIEIQVTAKPISQPQHLPVQKNVYSGKERDLFIETLVDKKKAYVNEQITLTFRFYRRIDLMSQPQYSPPDTSGFLTEDLPPQRNYYTVIEGKRYLVTEIKTALFPLSSGKFTIGPATLKCAVEDFGRIPDDFFSDDFFKRFFSGGRTVVLKSEPINIEVLNLPEENKPKDFSGAIGNFKITSYLDKNKVTQGEPLTLNISISGQGNIKTITQPNIKLEGFRQYDAVTSLDIKKDNYVVSGSKTFKIVIIPELVGKLTIPSVKFTYFDVISKSYKTIETQPLTLEVEKGKVSPKRVPLAYSEGTKIFSEDIRYIKTKLQGPLDYAPLYKNKFFLVLQLFPLMFFLVIWRYHLWQESIQKNIEFFRTTSAYKNANKKLRKLKKLVPSEIFEIFVNYFADKFNTSSEGITSDYILSELKKKNIENDLIDRVKSIWDELNFVQYAPTITDENKLKEIKKDISETIKKIEKYLRVLFLVFLFSLNGYCIELKNSEIVKIFKEANTFYEKGNFDKALELYEKIIKEYNVKNAFIFYNLGNCYYRKNKLGEAIFNYELAYKINPRDEDIKYNLNYAKSLIKDFQEKSFIEKIYTEGFTLNELFILVLVINFFLFISLSLLIIKKEKLYKNLGLALGVAFVISLVWFLIRFSDQRKIFAIVIQTPCNVRSGPGEIYNIGLSLPEGKKVQILGEEAEWYAVGLPIEHTKGWTEKSNLKKLEF
ncbi:MAG: BatD family protein, partial [Endomicrobiia bacterium]